MAVLNSAKITSKITTPSGDQEEVITTSNTHRANNVSTDFVITKSASKEWPLPKDTVRITTILTNNTDVNLERIKIQSEISEGATFVNGTVEIGALTYSSYDVTEGFVMPITLGGSGNEVRFYYDILIDDYVNVDKITDTTTATFTLDSQEFSVTSAPLELNFLNNEIYLLKEADKQAVKTGDIITYTITISNSGNYTNTDVKFFDTVPDSTTFITGSVKIDDTEYKDYDPNVGFSLNDLAPSATIKVEFQVKVD